MSEPDRAPCKTCGRQALVATLQVTGGLCRRCKPGQQSPRPAITADQSDLQGGALQVGAFKALRHGLSADLAADQDLILVFVPSLAVMLASHERTKGFPLTEDEVCAIRDKSVVMTMRRSHAEALAISRGYQDVDPDRCWSDWQEIRQSVMDAEQ